MFLKTKIVLLAFRFTDFVSLSFVHNSQFHLTLLLADYGHVRLNLRSLFSRNRLEGNKLVFVTSLGKIILCHI